MAVPARSVSFAKGLNKLSFVGVILLSLLIIITISLFLFYSAEFKKVNAIVASLKDQVLLLEKSEQKLILIKDKLGKINYVKSLPSSENNINQFKKLNEIVSLSSDSAFTEIDIGSVKTEVSLFSKDSTALSSVLSSFVEIKDYIKITLSSLGFSPLSGFSSSLIFESKQDI